MELDDIRLDEHVFQELVFSCDLEPHWRPQARLRPASAPQNADLQLACAGKYPDRADIGYSRGQGSTCGHSQCTRQYPFMQHLPREDAA
jgi:hypothetical protein